MSLVVPLLAMLSRELLGVLHELLAILEELFGELGAQRMLRFGVVDESHERLNN